MARFSYRSLSKSILLAGVAVLSLPAEAQPAASVREQADDVLAAGLAARMSLEEKLSQLVNVAPAIPRLNIPAYNWWTESLHGALGPVPTTDSPEPIGLAASFDPALVHDVARSISTEVRALHTLGRLPLTFCRSTADLPPFED